MKTLWTVTSPRPEEYYVDYAHFSCRAKRQMAMNLPRAIRLARYSSFVLKSGTFFKRQSQHECALYFLILFIPLSCQFWHDQAHKKRHIPHTEESREVNMGQGCAEIVARQPFQDCHCSCHFLLAGKFPQGKTHQPLVTAERRKRSRFKRRTKIGN